MDAHLVTYLHEQGVSPEDIAERMGTSVNVIQRMLDLKLSATPTREEVISMIEAREGSTFEQMAYEAMAHVTKYGENDMAKLAGAKLLLDAKEDLGVANTFDKLKDAFKTCKQRAALPSNAIDVEFTTIESNEAIAVANN